MIACLVSASMSAAAALAVLWLGIGHVAIVNGVVAAGIGLLLVLLRVGLPPVRAAQLLVALLFAIVAAAAGPSGGDATSALHTAALVPGVAILLCGPRAGLGWGVATCAFVIALWVLRANGFAFPVQLVPERTTLGKFPGVMALTLGVSLVILLYEWLRHRAGLELARARRDSLEAERARSRLEARMLETQRLESLGVLAGGVAHDFNNLLTVILGNASLLTAARDADTAETAAEIALAAEQAAGLTEQLLAYAGRSAPAREPTDLSALVQRIEALLRSSVGAKVPLRLELAASDAIAIADPRQIQQVALNLVTNAAEAVRGGGRIALRTGAVDVGADDVARLAFPDPLAPGRFAFLEVEDDGVGMDEATRARIFDPFFTTRAKGRGLGLSAALGIVRGHGGGFSVETAPGRGTRIRVLLPGAPAEARADGATRAAPSRCQGGVALVVDDEEPVRRYAARVLRDIGFQVHEARDGAEALRIVEREPRLDLVLLDATMPGLSGEQALEGIRRRRPGLPVILSTGDMGGFAAVDPGASWLHWLAKPYRAEALGEVAARALAEPRPAPGVH